MEQPDQKSFVMPAAYRKVENMHLIFWLFKDISWCMVWKMLGIIMVAPTMAIALLIAWRTRNERSEFAHNLAIIFWIAANSYWMISEFFHFDDELLFGMVQGKYLAIIPFGLGILILANYYILQGGYKMEDSAV